MNYMLESFRLLQYNLPKIQFQCCLLCREQFFRLWYTSGQQTNECRYKSSQCRRFYSAYHLFWQSGNPTNIHGNFLRQGKNIGFLIGSEKSIQRQRNGRINITLFIVPLIMVLLSLGFPRNSSLIFT